MYTASYVTGCGSLFYKFRDVYTVSYFVTGYVQKFIRDDVYTGSL